MPRRLLAAGFALALASTPILAFAQVRDRPTRSEMSPRDGAVRGRLEWEADGRRFPIRRARLTLSAEAGGTPRVAESDVDGRFQIDRLAPGTYRLAAEKPGFVPARPAVGERDAPVIDVRATETSTVTVLMERAGALAGRVVNDSGAPVGDLVVSADPLIATAEGDVVATPVRWERTDDLGRFRLHTLAPGRYRLHAAAPARSGGNERFYPATEDPAAAIAIVVSSGQTVEGLDFVVVTPPPVARLPSTMSTIRDPTAADLRAELATRLSGRVTGIGTGDPVMGAEVFLSCQGQSAVSARATFTDSNGRFQYTDLPAGQCFVRATAPRYVNPDVPPHKVVDVKPGEVFDTADIRLMPTSAVEGSVLDEFGDPVPGVSVRMLRRTGFMNRMRLVAASAPGSGLTDDRGWFRIHTVTPDDYFLLAVSGIFIQSNGWQSSLTAHAAAGFAPTYFPGTTSLLPDSAITIAPGTDTTDLAIRLTPIAPVIVSGVVTDDQDRPAGTTQLVLQPLEGLQPGAAFSAAVTTPATGMFSFRGVPPGRYVLRATGRGVAAFTIDVPAVTDAVVFDASLRLLPVPTVRGRLSFDGGEGPNPAAISLGVWSVDAAGAVRILSSQSRVGPTYEFEVRLPFLSTLIGATAPGWAVKRVMLNGVDITHSALDLQGRNVDGVDVMLTNHVGSVTGTVADSAPLPSANILLFPADSRTWIAPSRVASVVQANQAGEFIVRDLLPGAYLAVAGPTGPVGELDAALLEYLRPFATPIEVLEGPATSVTLKPILK